MEDIKKIYFVRVNYLRDKEVNRYLHYFERSAITTLEECVENATTFISKKEAENLMEYWIRKNKDYIADGDIQAEVVELDTTIDYN